MTKKQSEKVEALALQIQTHRVDFDQAMETLTNEVKEANAMKNTLVQKFRNISKCMKKTKRVFNTLENQTNSLLNRINKSEISLSHVRTAFAFEQQMRIQSDQQINVAEEQLKDVENQLMFSQIENDDLKERNETLSERLDFVKEARVHEMSHTCQKFEEVTKLLGSQKFATDIRSVRETFEKVKDVVAPSDSDEGLCVVCKNEKSTTVVIPCGHQCLCAFCAQEIEKKCPYCQTPFTCMTKLFVV